MRIVDGHTRGVSAGGKCLGRAGYRGRRYARLLWEDCFCCADIYTLYITSRMLLLLAASRPGFWLETAAFSGWRRGGGWGCLKSSLDVRWILAMPSLEVFIKVDFHFVLAFFPYEEEG